MACLSRYLENKLLDHVFNGITYSIPTVYLGLYTTLPSDDTGAGAVEVAFTGGTNYARKQTAASDWADSPSAGLITNSAALAMVQAGITWGNIVGFGLFDGATASANLLVWGPISPTKTVGQSDTANFPINGITIDPD